MAVESKGLARGSGALLGAEPRASASRGGGKLPLSYMQPGPFQPRREMQQEPLEELAASIKANGVIQPIVVRARPEGAAGTARYEIVAGERRWQAAKLAGLADIPVVLRELSDSEAVAVALIENIQREQLTPAEEARALKRLIEECRLTHEAVGKAVGRSRAAVTNLIRLLDLPPEVIALIDARQLSMGHARALLGLDDGAEQLRLGLQVARRGLSVRETESLVRQAPIERPKRAAWGEVARTAAVHVRMQSKAAGAARIVVDVAGATERDAIIEAIRKALIQGA